jgi:hypothetical protein
MRPVLGATFKGVVEGKKHTDGRKIFRAIATTPALDRYGEVVLPKGAVLDNFLKNPVLLEIHNYARTSVGQILSIEVTEKEMIVDFVFSTCARGMELQQKYEVGDMSAFSIGFDPLSKIRLWFPWDDPPQDLTEITVDLPDGTKQSVDLRGYDQIPYVIHTKWDLLELSPVPVPANPEALLIRQANDIIRKAMALDPVSKSFVQEEIEHSLAPALAMLEKFNAKFADDTLKVDGPVPFESMKGVDPEWNGADVRANLVRWAAGDVTSADDVKEKMNWAKYRKAFALLEGPVDTLSSYKFLHHTLEEGNLVVAWRGLKAAMTALLEDGEIEESTKGEVYKHLSQHYEDFGKEAPELKTYTADELKELEAAPLVVDEPTGEVAQPATSVASAEPVGTVLEAAPDDEVKQIRSVVDEIHKKVSRMLTEVTEEMILVNVKMGMIENHLAKKSEKSAPKPEVKKTDEEDVLFEVSPELLGRLKTFVPQQAE